MIYDLGKLAILKNLKILKQIKTHKNISLVVHLGIFAIQFYLILDPYQW